MSQPLVIARPTESEYAPYYRGYIARVPGEDLLAYFASQSHSLASVLRGVDDAHAMFRYAPGKWSIKEVGSHIIESERVFSYRALCISRGEQTPLPGFEENDYIVNGNADSRSVTDLIDEYEIVRRSTVALFRSLSPEMLVRTGTANAKPASVRGIAYTIAGHELHHLAVIAERYLGE